MKIELDIQMRHLLQEHWGTLTLAALKAQARTERTGVATSSIREEDGRRFFAAACMTDREGIRKALKVVHLPDSALNWETCTLLDIVWSVEGNPAPALVMEASRNGLGEVNAIFFMAAGPDSMTILERMFTFPA